MMSSPISNRFEGGSLVWTSALMLVMMTSCLLLLEGLDVAGARVVIRATARTSTLFFCAAFSASSLARIWSGSISAWMLRNRRYLGLSFGVSHTLHYIAVGAFAWLDRASFIREGGGTGPEKLVPVLMLGLLMATSFDGSARMWGPRAWKALHWVGTHFFWLAFFLSYAKRAPGSVFYSAWTALLIVSMACRIAGMASRLRERRSDGVRDTAKFRDLSDSLRQEKCRDRAGF